MKKRLTLTLSVDVIEYIKAKTKERKITTSQYIEEVFLEIISQEKVQGNLKKVS